MYTKTTLEDDSIQHYMCTYLLLNEISMLFLLVFFRLVQLINANFFLNRHKSMDSLEIINCQTWKIFSQNMSSSFTNMTSYYIYCLIIL